MRRDLTAQPVQLGPLIRVMRPRRILHLAPLDRDPPTDGLAPMSQQMLLRQALDADWPADRFNAELRAQAARREA